MNMDSTNFLCLTDRVIIPWVIAYIFKQSCMQKFCKKVFLMYNVELCKEVNLTIKNA